LLEAELEILLGRLGAREQVADRLDLLGCVAVGRAGDRELVVRQVVAGAHEREGLQRLGAGAHEARQRRIARGRDDPARPDRDSMDAMRRLDDSVAAHLDDDRLAHAREPYVPLRMVGGFGMVGICRPVTATTTRPRTRWSSPTP